MAVLVDHEAKLSPRPILVTGCRPGRKIQNLAEQSSEKPIVGIDLFDGMFEIAEKYIHVADCGDRVYAHVVDAADPPSAT